MCSDKETGHKNKAKPAIDRGGSKIHDDVKQVLHHGLSKWGGEREMGKANRCVKEPRQSRAHGKFTAEGGGDA